jgi:hypothetical protein
MTAATKKDIKKKPDYQTVVHVAFAPEVLDQIDAQAEIESRTRVNMVQVLVKQALGMKQETATV